MAVERASFNKLPEEIIEAILQACAANGSLARPECSLKLVCRTFNRMINRLMPDFEDRESGCLERIVIRVDATYHKGEWLRISFFWRSSRLAQSADLLCLTVKPQDLSDKVLGYWYDTMPWLIKHVDVCFVAPPSSSDYWGAFLMLYAKAADAFEWVFQFCTRGNVEEQISVHIRFEGSRSDQEADGIPFWQHKVPRNVPGKVFMWNRILPDPYFYEYLLCWATDALGPQGGDFQVVSVVHEPPIQGQCTSLLEGCWKDVIRRLELPEETLSSTDGRFQMWIGSRPTMSDPDVINKFVGFDDPEEDPVEYDGKVDNWADVTRYNLLCLVFGQHQQLKTNFRLYLDNHTGPRAGPADMTRLHRFKTLWKRKSDNNFFSLYDYDETEERLTHETRRRFHLVDVADEVAICMRELWNPAASPQAQKARSMCPWSVRFKWLNFPILSLPTNENATDRLWIEAYPYGISYTTVDGFPLISWECQWLCSQSILFKERTWECIACCEELAQVLGVVLRREYMNERWTFNQSTRTANPDDNLEMALTHRPKRYNPLRQAHTVLRHEAASYVRFFRTPCFCIHWRVWGMFIYNYQGPNESGQEVQMHEFIE